MYSKKRRILIVDDSLAARKMLEEVFGSDERFSLMQSAEDPYVAAQRIAEETPDVITLDIEMPRMNGLVFLRKIMRQRPVPVVIITGINTDQVEQSVQALYEGAVDVVAKSDINQFDKESIKQITDKVYQVSFSRMRRIPPLTGAKAGPLIMPDKKVKKVVLMGASSGGTRVLTEIISQLKDDIPPLLIVQHMSASFTKTFAAQLDMRVNFLVKEAEQGEELKNGVVYVAPGDRHLEVQKILSRIILHLNEEPPVNHVRPSVDVLFSSMARYVVNNVYAFLLTGMGKDGAEGMKRLYDKGAYTVAQDEESCVIYGMPKEALRLGGVSQVMNIRQIVNFINSL